MIREAARFPSAPLEPLEEGEVIDRFADQPIQLGDAGFLSNSHKEGARQIASGVFGEIRIAGLLDLTLQPKALLSLAISSSLFCTSSFTSMADIF